MSASAPSLEASLLSPRRPDIFLALSFCARSIHRALKRSRKTAFRGASAPPVSLAGIDGREELGRLLLWNGLLRIAEGGLATCLCWSLRRAWAADAGDDLWDIGEDANGDEFKGKWE